MERKKVLIVEDEQMMLDVLMEVLKKDYDVVAAANCSEALKHVAEPIDLALIDYYLPDGNGVDVLKALRKSNPQLPTIIMTGYSTEDLAIRALRAKVTDYVKKPLNFAFLERRIRELLFGGEGDDELEIDGEWEGLVLDGGASYIRENFSKELTLSECADKAHMDKFKFCRSFKKRFGQGFAPYINTVRLRNAAEVLKSSHLSIKTIAYSVGYNNVEHFNRLFKLYYGISPKEYRDRQASRAEAELSRPGNVSK